MRENVDVKDRKWRQKVYPKSFIGTTAVQWMMAAFAMTKEEAVKLGVELQKAGYFDHVVKEHEFKDKFLYYRFKEDQQEMDKQVEALGKKKFEIVTSLAASETIGEMMHSLKQLFSFEISS